VVASIGGNCLAFNGIVCRSCSDSCEEEAISFRLMIGGRSMPLVSSEKCTGCGECVAICPNDSINMRELQEAVA
jgi:ferredoxin-type protein NapF